MIGDGALQFAIVLSYELTELQEFTRHFHLVIWAYTFLMCDSQTKIIYKGKFRETSEESENARFD